ncbi:MAG: hypothetical protein PVI60_08455 [Desulfobacteraceae bacterium]|jgi:hypothetical protein
MREKWQKQIPLVAHILDHPQSQELEVISGIIDANPLSTDTENDGKMIKNGQEQRGKVYGAPSRSLASS